MANKIVATDRPFLEDFSGDDALNQSTEQLKDRVTHFANASMPEVLRKALYILQHSKNQKSVLQAAKLIKLIADGQIKGKSINAAVKKYSNEQIEKVLDGHADSED